MRCILPCLCKMSEDAKLSAFRCANKPTFPRMHWNGASIKAAQPGGALIMYIDAVRRLPIGRWRSPG